MLSTYEYPRFAYRRPPELDGVPTAAGPAAQAGPGGAGHYPVVVVGAGPVGLAAAIDLAAQGQAVLLLDDDDTVSVGSRGVCYAKRTLEVLDRLGCGDACVDKGVSWNVGRTFFREREVFNFNLCPEPDHRRPGMINLQQYYLEEFLVRRASALPALELRWKSEVKAVTSADDGARLQVHTPDGDYEVQCDWLVVADGARSPIRHLLGLDIDGKVFKDRFLIADVVMKADYPPERWFWFDPPFHPNQSVLLHRQADNVWRIDFQLGWDADPEEAKKPENVLPRIRAMLAADGKGERPFDLEWVSVYTFQCRRMQDFRHGRVLFVGDAAHQVSPFGARGANSGIQDTDNLVWKLKLVIDGLAPATLLDSYTAERGFAADENICNSTRSTDFITPKSATSKLFRNAVLDLARHYPFARALVNSGRLSVPAHLSQSPLNTPDEDAFAGHMAPGAPLDDAPLHWLAGPPAETAPWLLAGVGNRFQLLHYVDAWRELDVAAVHAACQPAAGLPAMPPLIVLPATAGAPDSAALALLPPGTCVAVDVHGRLAARYDLLPRTTYLLRPDQHVAARWRHLDPAAAQAARARACGHEPDRRTGAPHGAAATPMEAHPAWH